MNFENLGFVGFALGFLLIFWWLSRLMSASGRNEGGSGGGTLGA